MTAPWEQTAEEVRAAVNGNRPEAARLEVVRGSLADVRRTRWAWKDWAPLGAFLLIAGEPGTGKGIFESYLIAQWTLGQAPGDLEGEPVSVLWVGFEDSWPEVVLPRMVAAGADSGRLFSLRVAEPAGAMLDLVRDRDALGELVEEHEIRIVAFEALVDHLGNTDDHKNAEVRRALAPLVELAREKELLVVGTTHLNKTTTGGYRHRVAGSGGYLAVARAGWLVHRHPDNPELRVLAFGKGNLGRIPDSIVFSIESHEVANPESDEVADVGRVARDPEPYIDRSLTLDEVLAGPKPDHGSKEDDTVEFIRAFLADGPRSSADIQQAAAGHGISEKTLRKYRDDAGAELYQRGRGWWWRLRGDG